MTHFDGSPPPNKLQASNDQVLTLEYLRFRWGAWHKSFGAVNKRLVYLATTENTLMSDASVVKATNQFLAIWSESCQKVDRALLIRGLFGAWIPGHMRAAKNSLIGNGALVFVARTKANRTAQNNQAAIAAHLGDLISRGQKTTLLCHSKGGLETLLAIYRDPRLIDAVRSLALVQTARAPSPVLVHWLSQPKYFPYPAFFSISASRTACEEICSPSIEPLIAQCDIAIESLLKAKVPVVSVSSSARAASQSLESQHALMEKFGETLHDGLFSTESMLWHRKHPTIKQVYLPYLDHSQPGVGGNAFDAGRFWLTLARFANA
jgi:hypothetical protein